MGRAAGAGAAAGFAAVTKSRCRARALLGVAFAALFVFARARACGARASRVRRRGGAGGGLAVNAAVTSSGTRRPSRSRRRSRSSVVTLDVGQGTLRSAIGAGYRLLQVSSRRDFVGAWGGSSATRRRGTRRGCWATTAGAAGGTTSPCLRPQTPLPVLLLTLAGLAGAARLRRAREGRVLVLLVPPALFTCLLTLSDINIGVRYYLPAYPSSHPRGRDARRPSARRRGRRRALAAALASAPSAGPARRRRARTPTHLLHEPVASGRRAGGISRLERRVGDDVRGLAYTCAARGETRVGGALLAGSCWNSTARADGRLRAARGAHGGDALRRRGASLLNGRPCRRVEEGWE